jgi:hypothetical protein
MDPRENPEKNPEFGKHSILNNIFLSKSMAPGCKRTYSSDIWLLCWKFGGYSCISLWHSKIKVYS